MAELRALASDSFDAVITDPPYSSGGAFRGDRVNETTDQKYTQKQQQGKRPDFAGDNMDARAWQSWCYEWLTECHRVVRPGGYLCCFIDWRQLPALTDVVQWAGWVWRGVNGWDKGDGAKGPTLGYFSYQLEFIVWATKGAVKDKPAKADGGEGRMYGCLRQPVTREDKHHQTGKPTPVLRWLVRCAEPGGIVLDPFAGSGTTGVACVLEGRRFLGIEREGAYVDIARRRIAEAASGRPINSNDAPGQRGLFEGDTP
jgi:site-specific DNA-methyltransferase (adenine-specific)